MPNEVELRPEMRMAALLEAYGHERKKIAELVAVDVSTITRWRDRPEYLAEVELWSGKIIGLLEAKMGQAAQLTVEGGMKGLTVLMDIAENAQKDDGSPAYSARDRAAQALVGYLERLRADIIAPTTLLPGTAATAVTQVVIRMPDKNEQPTIDVEAEELE